MLEAPRFDNFYFEFTPEPCDGEMQPLPRQSVFFVFSILFFGGV